MEIVKIKKRTIRSNQKLAMIDKTIKMATLASKLLEELAIENRNRSRICA